MNSTQTILLTELPHLVKAAQLVNELAFSDKELITLKPLDQQNGVTTVEIYAAHSQAFFALAIHYGKNIENARMMEYMNVMMEENKD
jgi:hypothetical protein